MIYPIYALNKFYADVTEVKSVKDEDFNAHWLSNKPLSYKILFFKHLDPFP